MQSMGYTLETELSSEMLAMLDYGSAETTDMVLMAETIVKVNGPALMGTSMVT